MDETISGIGRWSENDAANYSRDRIGTSPPPRNLLHTVGLCFEIRLPYPPLKVRVGYKPLESRIAHACGAPDVFQSMTADLRTPLARIVDRIQRLNLHGDGQPTLVTQPMPFLQRQPIQSDRDMPPTRASRTLF